MAFGRLPPRPVGDFYGPFFRVEFFASKQTATGVPDSPAFPPLTGIPAIDQINQLKASTDNAFKLASDVKLQFQLDSTQLQNYAAHLSITSNGGGPLSFTLTLTPPYDVAIAILDNRLVRFESLVKVQWGYTGTSSGRELLSDEYVFKLMQPKCTFGRDIILTLQGWDVASSVLKTRERKEILTREKFPTDFDLIKELLRPMNIQIDDSLIPDKSRGLYAVKSSPIEQQDNDWILFRDMCRNNNLSFHITRDNHMLVYDMNLIVGLNTDYRFLWYRQMETDRDIPMMNFTANVLDTIFTSGAARSVAAINTDLDSGSIKLNKLEAPKLSDNKTEGDKTDRSAAGTGNYTGTNQPVGSVNVISKPPYTPFISGKVLSQPSSLNNRDEHAKQLVREAALMANTNATLVAPGMPDVFPPMNIRVEGVGESFSGDYSVLSAKHEIGTGGYEMTLEVYRTLSSPLTTDGNLPISTPTEPGASTGGTPTPASPDSTPATQNPRLPKASPN